MRIAVVNPPFIYNGRHGIRAGSRWPFTGNTPNYFYCPYPMMLGYTASYLLSHGHEVMFYDAIGWRHGYETFFNKVWEFKPDLVIQETSTPSRPLDLMVAKNLAQFTKVILCGPDATVMAEEFAQLPYVHAVFKGVFEEHALSAATNIPDKGHIYEAYKIKNLDEYPYPFRADYMKCDSRSGFKDENKAYTMYYDPCNGDTPEPMLFATTSRGCPYSCSFCLWPHVMFGNKVVWRNPNLVLQEIEFMVRKHGYRSVYFDDDTMNANSWANQRILYDGLKDIGVPWLMLGRLDCSTTEEFEYMAKCGCSGYRLGVESLSQQQLDAMNKKLKVEDILKKISDLKKLGPSLYLLFMHGLPGETPASRLEHEAQIKALGERSQDPVCIPFPGTPYFNEVAELVPEIKNLDPIEFDGCNLSNRVLSYVEEYWRRKNAVQTKVN